jgi:hypothetical protein
MGKLAEKARKYFGETRQCTRAGYILKDGTMLDFGDHENPRELRRTLDHASIGLIGTGLGDVTIGKFLDKGNVRVHVSPSYTFMQTHSYPNPKQWETVKRCVCNFEENMNSIQYERREDHGYYSDSVSEWEDIKGNCRRAITAIKQKAKQADKEFI